MISILYQVLILVHLTNANLGMVLFHTNSDEKKHLHRETIKYIQHFVLHVITLKGFEALQGNSGGTGNKLQQSGSALFIKWLHGLDRKSVV